MKRISLILFCLSALLLAGCRAKPQAPAVPQLRDFPYPAVPAVYTDPEERRDWILDHFWDAFLAGDGPCDTSAVLGVRHSDVEGHEEIKARHDEQGANPYVIDKGNQAVWGWLTFNVEAGESYCVYQQSSQLGFGGFEFGDGIYVASFGPGGIAPEFAAVVDGDGKATNVNDRGSVVSFTTCGVDVEAVGGAVPTEVTPNLETGIANVKAELESNAPRYNLAGQKVAENYKGVVIQNGRKMIQ